MFNFRYCVLDIILRTIEALSVIDDYSQEVSSNRELFRLLVDLVKTPDKIEVHCCCTKLDVCVLLHTYISRYRE